MKEYFVRRLVSLVFVLIGMSLLTFTLSHLIPADPARAAAGPNASGEAIENIRQRMGLDRSLPEQYLIYMKKLLAGDLGEFFDGLGQVEVGHICLLRWVSDQLGQAESDPDQDSKGCPLRSSSLKKAR